MAWTTLFAVLVAVGCVHCDNSRDISILSRAITSTREKLSLMIEETMVLTNLVTSNLMILKPTVEIFKSNITTMNDAQDSLLNDTKNEIDDQLEDLEDLAGDAAEADTLSKANNERFKALWKQVDDLNAQNNLQSAQLAALSELERTIDDDIDEKVSNLEDISDGKLDVIMNLQNSLMDILQYEQCEVEQVTVNVTTDEGRGEVSLDLSSFFTDIPVVPSIYCAFSGIISTINEPIGHGYGYGYKPSDRELTGFVLGCDVNTQLQGSVWVLDRSQSERAKDEVQSVSITVKICSFSPLGLPELT